MPKGLLYADDTSGQLDEAEEEAREMESVIG